MSFAEAPTYQFGVAGESRIAHWLRRYGYSVLPVYEKLVDEGKGPQLYLPEGSLIAPDLLAFKAKKTVWIEAKHKTAFSWHRLTQRWVTGIDLRHYKDYCRVQDETPWDVWLLFLHEGGQAKDSPADSPSGLFGNRLAYLRCHVNHRSDKWGRTGMVYWALEHLKKLGKLDELAVVEATT